MTNQEKLNKKIQEILDICGEKEHLFRGENFDYGKVSSTLYRQRGDIPVNTVLMQEKIITINEAKNHVSSGASDIEVLTELQHHGGKTSLIDFTRNIFIALFFACDESSGFGVRISGARPDEMIESSESGRIILFDATDIPRPKDMEDQHDYAIFIPPGKNPRVVFQSSVFVRSAKGYIEEDKYRSIAIEKDIKPYALDYLDRYHGINSDTIYNDLQGFIRNQQGLYRREEHDNRAVELSPQNPEAYYRLGNTRRKLGKLEEAIKSYDRSIQLDPNAAEVYVNRGIVKAGLGMLEESIEDFNKAIELDPELSQAYTNRGFAKFKLSRFQQAIRDYNKAIRLNPGSFAAYNNRGQVKLELDKPQESIADCDQAIKLNPKIAEPYLNRGFVKFKLGKFQEAIRDCNKAIELNPMAGEAYNNRGIAKGELGKLEEAIKDFDKAIELNPEYAEAYSNRAKAKELSGKLKEAIEDYDRLINLNPKDAVAYYKRAIVKRKLGRVEEAQNDFVRALELNPNLRKHIEGNLEN